MPKKSTQSENSAEFPSAPELICITEPSAGVRSRSSVGLASESGANIKSLNAALKAAGDGCDAGGE